MQAAAGANDQSCNLQRGSYSVSKVGTELVTLCPCSCWSPCSTGIFGDTQLVTVTFTSRQLLVFLQQLLFPITVPAQSALLVLP